MAAVMRCPKAALIAQCYTSNSSLTKNLVPLVPVYSRIAKACPQVEIIAAFSGSGRATGLQDHPEVRPSWDTLAAGIPSAPKPIDQLEPWHVSVLHWDPSIRTGQRSTFGAALGNGVSVEWQKEADDTVHMAVFKDGVQQDRSSLPRRVTIG